MNRGLNKVLLIGRLAETPELRQTPTGRSVVAFPLATPRQWHMPEGEAREEVEWFNVVAWGKLAEICHKHLVKEQRVYIEGHLRTRGWEDEHGKRHFRTEVVAHELVPLDKQEEN